MLTFHLGFWLKYNICFIEHMNIHLYTMHFCLTMCFVTLLLSKLCTCAYTCDFPSELQQCHKLLALQIQKLLQKKKKY